MSTNGVRTADIANASAVDNIIGNRAGSTVVIPMAGLVSQVMALIGPPFTTLAQLNADLDWSAGAIGAVYGDTVSINNGVYKKNGASGEGTWTRIGDLAITTIAQQFISDLQQHLADDDDPHGLVTLINALTADLNEHGHTIDGIDGLAAQLETMQGINVKADDRPGDAPHSFSVALTGSAENKAPIANTPIVVNGLGLAYPMTGTNVLARRDPIALGNDVWEFSARLARTSNPADPNNHSLELRVAWLNDNKALVSDQALQSNQALLTSDGIVTMSARVSAAAVDDVIAPPSNAVYAVPYLKTYGDDGDTAVASLRASEITDLHGVSSVDFSQLLADVQAIIALANNAVELVATETLETMGDITSYTRPAGVGVVTLKGGYAAFDGLGGQWAFVPGDTVTAQELPWMLVGADGARYRRVDGTIYESVTALLNSNEPSLGVGSIWTADGYTYVEAAASATDHHMTLAGGVKLYVKPIKGKFHVPAFGPSDDESADERELVQRALDASAGQHLYFGSRSYRLVGQLTIPTPESTVEISTSAEHKITLEATETDQASIKVTANRVTILGGNFDASYNATNTTSRHSGCNVLYFENTEGCVVDGTKGQGGHYFIHFENNTAAPGTNINNSARNCQSDNAASTGFITSYSTGTEFYGCRAFEAGNDGFKTAEHTEGCRIINNLAERNGRDGFDLYDGFLQSVITGNIARDNAFQGFELKGNFGGSLSFDDYTLRQSIISDNVADGNGENSGGTAVPNILIQQVRSAIISNNMASNGFGDGFKLVDVQTVSFVGCYASRNAEHGWNLNTSVSRCMFNACLAWDNSWEDGTVQNGTYHGFYLASGTNGEFVGCSTGNSTLTGKKGGQGYGWYFADGSTKSGLEGFYGLGNVTGTLGGQSAGYVARQRVASGYNAGTLVGVRALNDAATEIGMEATGNADFAIGRTGGAQARLQAQSALAVLTTTTEHPLRFGSNGSQRWELATSGALQPVADATYNVGGPSNRVNGFYGSVGAIITSDRNAKQDIQALQAAEKRVAIACKPLLQRYKFKDAVAERGDAARYHFGVIAQDVVAAFEAEGLNPFSYGVICFDQWEAQEEVQAAVLDAEGKPTGEMEIVQVAREAGERFGVRYDELFAMIIAAL